MCVLVWAFFEDCLYVGGVLGGFKLDYYVCPELLDARGDWGDGYGGFVEGAFDLAGDDYGEFLGFARLGE